MHLRHHALSYIQYYMYMYHDCSVNRQDIWNVSKYGLDVLIVQQGPTSQSVAFHGLLKHLEGKAVKEVEEEVEEEDEEGEEEGEEVEEEEEEGMSYCDNGVEDGHKVGFSLKQLRDDVVSGHLLGVMAHRTARSSSNRGWRGPGLKWMGASCRRRRRWWRRRRERRRWRRTVFLCGIL